MKKFIKSFLLAILLINLALTIQMAVVNTQAYAEVKSPSSFLNQIGNEKETGLSSFQTGQHPDAPPDYAQPGVGAVTSPVYFAIDMFRYAISGLALLVIIISAIKLVSVSSEEDAGKVKNTLIYGIIGLLMVQLADVIVKKMFFGETGDAFEDAATAELYAEESVLQIRGIIGFVEIFVGAVAVLIIIIRGFMLITNPGDEEGTTKIKNHIIYALVGLLAVGLSEIVVRGFIFPDAGESLPDTEKGKQIIIMLTNYLAGFISVISFLMLLYAGFQYVTSGGEEETKEKVKKIFTGALIALLLALGAFAAVHTLVKFEEPADTIDVNLPESN